MAKQTQDHDAARTYRAENLRALPYGQQSKRQKEAAAERKAPKRIAQADNVNNCNDCGFKARKP